MWLSLISFLKESCWLSFNYVILSFRQTQKLITTYTGYISQIWKPVIQSPKISTEKANVLIRCVRLFKYDMMKTSSSYDVQKKWTLIRCFSMYQFVQYEGGTLFYVDRYKYNYWYRWYRSFKDAQRCFKDASKSTLVKGRFNRL